MRGLDDTDREIIDLLLEDGRRPYSEIAETVDLSPPAVSDRVDRLQELGVVQGFTVDIDRSMLRGGIPVLVDVQVTPGNASDVSEAVATAEPVEHIFETADQRIVFTAIVSEQRVQTFLADMINTSVIETYDVDILVETNWQPDVGNAELTPDCAECGNTVTEEGESTRLDEKLYHFCCSSCRSQFVERYEELRDDTTS